MILLSEIGDMEKVKLFYDSPASALSGEAQKKSELRFLRLKD